MESKQYETVEGVQHRYCALINVWSQPRIKGQGEGQGKTKTYKDH